MTPSLVVALAAMLLAPAAHAARVTLSPAAGPAGSKVTLRGSGFAARATVHVSAAGRGRASAKTSARGKFQAVLRVPRAGRAIRLRSRAGSRQVVNVYRVSAKAVALERELALSGRERLRWTPADPRPGSSVALRGRGLPAAARARIALVGPGQASQAARLRTKSTGRLRARVPIPAGARGPLAISLRVGRQRLRLPLIVRSARAPGPGANTGPGPPSPAAPPAAGGTSPPQNPVPPPGPCGTSAGAPAVWKHVAWIVMENHAYSQVIGSTSAPYENSLATQCGLATNYFGITHPSLPNYIAMTSGDTQGITDDSGPSSHPLSVPSIFSQLGTGGWRSLQESMPSNCALSSSGQYAVRHNPAAYYTNIRTDCASYDVPLGATPDISAPFTFVTPNLCNDTHDCSVTTGDDWLKAFIAKLTSSPEYQAGSTAIFVTWDEDDFTKVNTVATIVIAPSTIPGTRDATQFNHYSLLRTTEEMLGLSGYLGGAGTATSMRSVFHL